MNLGKAHAVTRLAMDIRERRAGDHVFQTDLVLTVTGPLGAANHFTCALDPRHVERIRRQASAWNSGNMAPVAGRPTNVHLTYVLDESPLMVDGHAISLLYGDAEIEWYEPGDFAVTSVRLRADWLVHDATPHITILPGHPLWAPVVAGIEADAERIDDLAREMQETEYV